MTACKAVASENAAMIAPAGNLPRVGATRVRAVDYIVVDKRGAVKKFDYGGQTNRAGAVFTGVCIGEKEQLRGAGACHLHREDSW